MNELLKKRISIGLNLNEPEQDIYAFLDNYKEFLSSLYFSLPLGGGFYSRNELAEEYEAEGAEEKLLRILNRLKDYNIQSEVAINMYGLKEKDLEKGISYMNRKGIYPDEIVCLDEYGEILKNAFPRSEMKYSFNNPGKASSVFDTIVVGKGYLRDQEARHKIIDEGKNLVLLLNNGCSFECHYPCGDSKFCGAILDENLKYHDLNYMYALQSFFPSELMKLLEQDTYAEQYRFKISNRPLGLEFSKRVMDTYCGLLDKTEVELLEQDSINFALYCVMGELFRRRDKFSIEKICEIKKGLKV